MSGGERQNVFNFQSGRSTHLHQESVDFGGTGGAGGGGDMLERVARLESDVAHIQRDVTGITQKLDRVAEDVNDLKVSMASMAGKQDVLETKLDAMDQKFEAKIGEVSKKFDGLEKKFATKEDLQTALHNQTKWLIVSMLGIVAGTIGFLKYFGT